MTPDHAADDRAVIKPAKDSTAPAAPSGFPKTGWCGDEYGAAVVPLDVVAWRHRRR